MKNLFLVIIAAVLFSACSPQTADLSGQASETPTRQLGHTEAAAAASTPDDLPSSDQEGTFFGLTYQREDGSRAVEGTGQIPTAQPLRVTVEGEISWLTVVPYRDGSLWTAVLRDGRIQNYWLHQGEVEQLQLGWESLPPGTPPLVAVKDGQVSLIQPPGVDASSLSHPILLPPDWKRLAYLTSEGDLVVMDNGQELDRLPVNALPDARILTDEQGRLLLLTDPTDRYDHAVLGDGLEAGSLTLLETDPELQVVTLIEIPGSAVIEGTAPIWADLNGDGEREILVTVSSRDGGARLELFSESGERLAAGPAAGQAYRWRHQIAAAPLGPEGELLIVNVLRPHLDAVVEIFRWEGDQLVLIDELPGFSSHMIGSRNLDQALVGDLDGDGNPELVVPDISRRTLNGIAFQEGSLQVIWDIDLQGELTSNLAGAALPDGELVLGLGVGEHLLLLP